MFKTVCGALLRRPGWVRFPSIPASQCCTGATVTRNRHAVTIEQHRRTLADVLQRDCGLPIRSSSVGSSSRISMRSQSAFSTVFFSAASPLRHCWPEREQFARVNSLYRLLLQRFDLRLQFSHLRLVCLAGDRAF